MSTMRGALALVFSTLWICFECEAQENPALSLEVETLFNTVNPIERKKTKEGILF